jgi:exodeoxyribonuclease III
MRVATWNVNGIRARQAQVLEWIAREQPDVVCLQELKAARAQVPDSLAALAGYWSFWHGTGAYSGVALLLAKERFPDPPSFAHPEFDFETRVVTTEVGGLLLASVYVPNGGKDFAAKMRFLEAMKRWVGEVLAAGRALVLCGDLNVTRTDMDVHPKERKLGVIGQRPEERALLEGTLGLGLVDVGRALDPENDSIFTWWPPWRNMRQRNIGWRLDYVLASAGLACRAAESRAERDVGTSDHAPVAVTFADT